MKIYHVEEQTPPIGEFKQCYSQIRGLYYICKWNPVRGWLDQTGDYINSITHWFDYEFPMPYPVTDQVDEELAKHYGFSGF